MNKRIAFTLLTAVLAFFMPLGVSRAAVMDKVLAIVNDEPITQSELDRVLLPVYKQYRTQYSQQELVLKLDEIRKNILNQMISDKLILSEAKKKKIEVKPEEIEGKLKDAKKKFPSEDAFQQTLVAQGYNVTQLQQRFKEDLMKDKFIDSEIRKKILITPGDINNYYNANIDKFKVEPRARILGILIKVKEGETKEDARNRAKSILEKIKNGENFSELATQYSEGPGGKEGGEMGYVAKGQLRKELDDAIFSLKTEEVSDVIESGVGYHIFKVLDKKDEVVIRIDEVYNEIRDVIYSEKAKARFAQVLEELRKNAYISIK
ncbi:MAG: hypothetical protein COS99_04970 [Candidatus Omnitrophica bacterium CG07_land_8_20_14_0_80_42_15]|uniref:PpiC domain-containing protein n=1 Tax=Candidatus Aquitaenariimonas noxiae TaxID=1974741 RepID=A0A2J0KSP3_9BACT|nr:MAG: hypothetical protein COS99_04970 [Candidatus Omnitrophica bacterium CG07_land_8_20_14_0_80_42_15]